MEYLDIVDENNRFTNEVKSRKLVHENGLWHREIAVWIIKDKNKALLQKRAESKKLEPNKWSLTAGHVTSGESIIKTAIREVTEELGIEKIGPSDLKLIDVQKCEYVLNGLINNMYRYIYVLQTNLEEKEFEIQKEELSEVKYMELEELKKINKTKSNLENYNTELFEPRTRDSILKIEKFLKEDN